MSHPYIEQLSKDLILSHHSLREGEGKHVLQLGNDLTASITLREGDFFLQGMLGACPASNAEEFLCTLMHANLFGQGTHGAVIGMSDSGNMLTFSQALPAPPNYPQFKEKLEDFINYLELWQGKVAAALNGAR
jgi:hypothetical protein